MQRKLGRKANLRLVGTANLHKELPGLEKPKPPPPRLMDDVTRSGRIRLIREFAKSYSCFGIELLVKQATLGYPSIDWLPDEELLQLHRDIDRARECISEGVAFEEAGLIRSLA